MTHANDRNDSGPAASPDGLAGEELYGLTDLAKHLPKINGKRPSVCTLWRWCLKGIHGVHLEHTRWGRTIASSVEAVERFSSQLAGAYAERIQARRMGHAGTPRPITPAARQRQLQAALKRLEEAGIR